MLGIYQDGFGVVLNVLEEYKDESYKLQMDLSKDLISNTAIRYICYINDGKTDTEVISIDKKRFDVLMYGRNEIEFDFEPKMWPTMARSYWKTFKEAK